MNKPSISVIMPVYNSEKYLADAIDSILNQTYKDFEFIIICDPCKDNSVNTIKAYIDPRIILVENKKRLGLVSSLNLGIQISKGNYIARMDADDVSQPQRFEKQIKFFKKNQTYGMVGSWSEIWEESTKTLRSHFHSIDNSNIKFDLLFDSPFVHASVMIRKEVFDKVGLYCPLMDRQPEDYELWTRIGKNFKMANIPEKLVIYREVNTSLCRSELHLHKNMHRLRAENFSWVLGDNNISSEHIKFGNLLTDFYQNYSGEKFKEIEEFLNKLAYGICKKNNCTIKELEKNLNKRLELLINPYCRAKYGRFLGRAIFEIWKMYNIFLLKININRI